MVCHQYTPLTNIASIVSKPSFASRNQQCPLPKLFIFTDPKRSPDLFELAQNLPAKSVLVYRHFSEPSREKIAIELKYLCQQQGAKLLIGADPKLARAIGADGVHLPQSMIKQLPAIRAKHQFSLITCAAHTVFAGRQGIKNGAMAVIVSCVFPSSSTSASAALGNCRFRDFVKKINAPVIALGGINETNVRKLNTACHGVAIVSGAFKGRS
jgi:thiamine-phosphate pyrophosphorylase